MLDKHPHRILIRTENPRKLAESFIPEDPVYGVRFAEHGALEVLTNDLSAAHEVLPRVIVDSGLKITSIENPDDNLDALLGYLVGDSS